MADPPLSAANDSSAGPDAHGQAAILLVESLLHGLIARSLISVEDALEIIDTATEVQSEMVTELEEVPTTMGNSLAILAAISASLRQDIISAK